MADIVRQGHGRAEGEKIMTAKKQALIGMVGGVIVTWACIIAGLSDRSALGPTLAIGVPMGMLYGFGYIFSLPIIKKWGAWAAGVSGSIAFSALVSQLFFRRGLITGLFISIMLLVCSVGFAYIPGIFIGIKAIWNESRR